MKSIKRALTFIAFMIAAGSVFTIASNVSAERLDTHTGILASYAENRTAYNDSACTSKANHYLCPADWYDKLGGNSSYVKIKYPITIQLKYGGEKRPIFFTYYFKYSEYHKYADSSTGSFSVPFNSSSWYNKLPGKITYTDETDNGNTGNGSKCYVSNNYGFSATSADKNNNKVLKCADGSPIMYADYVPADGRIYYNYNDKKDADWHWTRESQSWSTDNLHQGKNTVYYAGTDASANYTTGSRDFYYDTLKPICFYNMDSKSGVLQISADDDNSAGGEYSGLDYFRYRISSDSGNTWSSWSSNCTEPQKYTLKDPGNYILETYAVDKAGNSADSVFTGIVKIAPPLADAISNTYRTDIDVISAITLKNTSTSDILPTDNYTVKFDIPGITTQTKAFTVPGQKSTTVWFKWHTPTTSGNLTGAYTINSGGIETKCNAAFDILKLTEQTPPDPKGTDTMPNTFSLVSPTGSAVPSLSWTDWSYENSAFKQNNHTASLVTTLSATPDSNCPTATKATDGFFTMKSGYGINEKLTSTVYTDEPQAVTPCQNVIGMYPEFQYNNFYRLFEKLSTGTLQLKSNKFSMYNSRTHFMPVWWKDGVDYLPQTYSLDAWTPAGMLTSYSTDTLHISGSVYDDWHVWPKN